MRIFIVTMIVNLVVYFSFLHIIFAANEDLKPTIVNGQITQPVSPVEEQMLLSTVRIGKARFNENGQPDFSNFRGGCTATIVGSRQLTSAVHCFSPFMSVTPYYAEIRLSLNPDKRKYIRIDSMKSTLDYDDTMKKISEDPYSRGLDLTTLQLTESVPNENIAKICGDNLTVSNEYTVAGYGLTEANDTRADNRDLRHTSVQMNEITDGVLYSKPVGEQENGSTACYGDSGGPLYSIDRKNKSVCLAGAVSGTDLKGKAEEKGAELCARKDLRQIFARASWNNINKLSLETKFPEKPPKGGVTGGSPGNLGEEGENGETPYEEEESSY